MIGSFAADHVIGEPRVFADCVREAVAVARTGYVVTIGIEPTRPATGFGYIHVGDRWLSQALRVVARSGPSSRSLTR